MVTIRCMAAAGVCVSHLPFYHHTVGLLGVSADPLKTASTGTQHCAGHRHRPKCHPVGPFGKAENAELQNPVIRRTSPVDTGGTVYESGLFLCLRHLRTQGLNPGGPPRWVMGKGQTRPT